MIELDGVQFTVKTPSENTEDMRTAINTYCSNNAITNSKNETVVIEANFASPIYMILWALGYLVTVIQNLVYSVGKAFNVQSANDTQLLNLADIAGVKRGKQSKTTFSIKVTAMTTDNTSYDSSINEGNCIISSDDIITYNGVTYTPALYPSITLAPGEVGYITLVANTEGSYAITEGSITGFDTSIANLDTFYQYTSTPGQKEETIASLRERIQRRQYSGTSIDSCMDAIRSLEGVTLCNIYYNTNISDSMQIGDDGIILPARWALIVVQGYNPNIGSTFFNYLTCPTITYDSATDTLDYSNLNGHTERILAVQWYVSHAQQRIPVLILKPKQIPVYIKVYLGTSVVSSIEVEMKSAIADIAVNLTAGQSITSAMILEALSDYTAYSILGAMVSTDNTTYAYTTTQAEDVLFVLNTENISIDMQE